MAEKPYYERVLVAIDYSPPCRAALNQALWLVRKCGVKLTLKHAAPGSKRLFQIASEIRQESELKMRQLLTDLQAGDLDAEISTRIGEPFIVLIHAVQHEGFDLVLAGTRGVANWEQFFMGSTAKRLIRKCPASVWIVQSKHVGPPRVVLAPTDFSEVSRKAVLQGFWLAEQAGAAFHLIHVVDSNDVQEPMATSSGHESEQQQEINRKATERLAVFIESLGIDPSRIRSHLIFGTPWKEIQHFVQLNNVDLIAMGTVGRSGLKGLFLGSTAEKVLDTCDCGILATKPDGFVSPVEPEYWTPNSEQERDQPTTSD